MRAMRLTASLLAVTVLAGCTTSVTGESVPPHVVGTLSYGGAIDVTLVSYVDPAPLDQSSQPQDGDRLVAAQLRIHNNADHDYLVDPITEVSVTGGGHEYKTSLADTSAGVMLDQVSLAPDQTVLGYVTLDVPQNDRVTEVRYEPKSSAPLTWQVSPGGQPRQVQSWPDARKRTHALGQQITITNDGTQLTMAPVKYLDPAPPQPRVDVGTGQHVIQVDFTVFTNVGQDPDNDPTLRSMTLFDNADQSVNAHVYSMQASVDRPLSAGAQTTWPVQFVVPDGFAPDHVAFRPEFGSATTTQWALS